MKNRATLSNCLYSRDIICSVRDRNLYDVRYIIFAAELYISCICRSVLAIFPNICMYAKYFGARTNCENWKILPFAFNWKGLECSLMILSRIFTDVSTVNIWMPNVSGLAMECNVVYLKLSWRLWKLLER
jgi:hypothetical protein